MILVLFETSKSKLKLFFQYYITILSKKDKKEIPYLNKQRKTSQVNLNMKINGNVSEGICVMGPCKSKTGEQLGHTSCYNFFCFIYFTLRLCTQIQFMCLNDSKSMIDTILTLNNI